MSNYIPHYTKKLRARRRAEEALVRAIHRGDSDEKLLRLAANLRDAGVRALKAERAEAISGSEILTAKIEAARQRTIEGILKEFGYNGPLFDQRPD